MAFENTQQTAPDDDTPAAAPRRGRSGRGRDPERRRTILDAADRVIQRDGPDASMLAIATEAGISKPILYRHFGDKGGLYQALAQRHVDPLIEAIRSELYQHADFDVRARATVGAYLSMISQNLNLYRFLMDRATSEDVRTRSDLGLMVRRLGEELADLLLTEGRIRDRLRAQIAAHAVVGMVQAAGEWWLEHPEVSEQEIIDDLTGAVVGAIRGSGT
ncbi:MULTISPECIES: TetR/AcrR family transcriptional regulator [Nocardiopsis]|uniref:TetR/AcrR family transcriptional regulator n=1 Tax=Nocardiopsis TaxID=2013 RepID=UPI000346A3E7|nr:MULTISPECIES: TetR family transcriptional regulator [Nocardiopsis]MBQ1081002.1 TetR/AcrR family transcriptional regulator [Nocardiopsis sp. B62]PWV54819.1 TetR family transcriptional regulator [Nocardiopsis sp. L17-MgMaSL7]